MLRNELYYGIKPLIPVSVRFAVRSWFSLRKRKRVTDIWPILPGSERPPEGWRGWPEGKKFAFVLTHDVERQAGLDKCRQLMELEMKWGFRSSFNFIPEGDYHVSKEFRDELTRNGFEAGIHDLKHDGKLFRNRHQFAANAIKINNYLKDWGAVGFRSGFMLHNLEWLHDLNISYDASTFDTDPFEPQPDNLGTIFPFWVPGPGGQGYVELPYTLPQDSTLFILLRETSPDIWTRKLDWLARNGGMVLLDTHPDYIRFPRGRVTARSFPAEFYETFLKHVAERYAGQYWHVLPKELAAWHRGANVAARAEVGQTSAESSQRPVESIRAERPLKSRRAAVVLYSYYASDPRPRREAEALAKNGMEVDVICLRKDNTTPLREHIDGVNVLNMPLKRRRLGKIVYALQYTSFLAASFLVLSLRSVRKRYQVVHVHNMPDFLVFSALVPRWRGAKVILDLHDPMPELFHSLYGVTENHFAMRFLKQMERRSIAFADLVLTPNKAFRDTFLSRSCSPEKIHIVMNTPQTTIFDPEKYAPPSPTPRDHSFTLLYHGLLVERHGLDLAVRAIAQLAPRVPHIKLHLYGDQNDYVDRVLELARTLGLQEIVQYHGFKPLSEIAGAITKVDLGLVPNRLNSFTQINLPTRIFECLAMNKPVLVPRTRGIQDYFNDQEILYFEPGNVDDLAARIEWAYRNPEQLRRTMERGRAVYCKHRWELEESQFIGLVQNLVNK